MRKVSQNCHNLVTRGLLDGDEARRVILVAALASTLAGIKGTRSADELARIVGLTAEGLAEEVEKLRSLGFAVAPDDTAVYRFTEPFDDLLMPEAVLPLLLERAGLVSSPGFGLPYLYKKSCGSTNRLLKEMAAASPTGMLVVTDDQIEGRGRSGRAWVSEPRRDLTFSVLLRPSLSSEDAPRLSLAVALAVAEVLEKLVGLEGRVRVKWPNDVLVDDRKVCGILLESSLDGTELQWVVVGVGLNVNSDPASYLAALRTGEKQAWKGKPSPSSLLAETGHKVARGRLLVELVSRLSTVTTDVDTSDFLARMRTKDALFGRRVQVFAGTQGGALVVTGQASGLGPKGELLVCDEQGKTVSVVAGEVTLNVDS